MTRVTRMDLHDHVYEDKRYAWDDEDRLLSVRTSEGETRLKYDCLGRRIEKQFLPTNRLGGFNLYGYVGDPNGWIDPWGWCPATVATKKGAIKAAGLPTKGKIRYVPPKNWKPSIPLPKGRQGFIDRFGNEWVKEPSRTAGQHHEWDVQLSSTGKQKIGWATRDGSHANISLDGHITDK